MSQPKMVKDTPHKANRRKITQHESRIHAKAIELLENDPDVSTMREARKKAREVLELDLAYSKGSLSKKDLRRDPVPPAVRRKAKHVSARSTSAVRRGLRKTARNAAAPFGSAASAWWTFVTGGVSVVLLYVVLREADAVTALGDGLSAGVRSIADPYRPLIPTKGESAPPPPRRRTVTNQGRKR